MKRAFVIGHPISHSRSPKIHGYWLEKYGIAGSYEAIDVAPVDLGGFFERIRAGEFVGGNVTVPHKEGAFDLCDTRDLDTAHIGAFNTLTTSGEADSIVIHGTNTDQYGFLANLDDKVRGWDTGIKTAIVLGAGGAARGVVSALVSRGVPRIVILNRTVATAEQLAAELPGPIFAHGLDAWAMHAPNAQFVVNTTTIGMHGTRFEGIDLSLLPKTALVTDIVYTPLETPLLADAKAQGLKTADGLGMLLHQAVPGFEVWFGVRPEVTPELRKAIEATL
ncbi:MAG TPA: shikimate dehydrogenase [Devosia sp.]|nr:shikimate dehydrogenase [Devosia sp.]